MFIPAALIVINEKKKLFSQFKKDALPAMDVLYNFALKMTGSEKETIKLLKKTYSKAFWFYDHLDERINVSEWLFRIIRNTFIDEFKKAEGEPKNIFEEKENYYEEIKSSGKNKIPFEEEIKKNITAMKLSEIISKLPVDLRFVIVLSSIHKMNYEEIADFVDVPVGVVISRLIKARKIIFTELYKYYGER